MILRRGTSYIVQYIIVALLTSGLLLYSDRLLSMQWQMGLFRFWMSLLLLVVSESMPILTGKKIYCFRIIIQFPIIVLFGLSPVLVAQIAIIVAQYLIRWVLLRTAEWNFFNYLTATIPPTIAATVLQLFRQSEGILHIPSDFDRLCALISYIIASYLIYWISSYSPVTHPWRAIKGLYLMMLVFDAIMAMGALLAPSLLTPWAELAVAFQFIAILATIKLYINSSIQRFRLIETTKLMTSLTEYISLEELAPALLTGLSQILSMDGAVFWICGEDRQLHPMFVQDFSADKSWKPHFELQFGSIASGVGIEGFSFSSRETVRIHSNSQPTRYHDIGMKDHYSSAMVSPIFVDKDTYGVIAIYHQKGIKTYGRREADLLTLVSSQLGSMLVQMIRYEESCLNSHLDELTGVYNYRFFDSAIDHQIQTSHATAQPLTLLILDIDHFKEVNDKYGHLAGNHVLVLLAQLLREMVRESDILARYGGEEFTILLPGLGSEESQAVAERIRRRIEATRFPVEEAMLEYAGVGLQFGATNNTHLRLTVSIGLATYPTGADSAMTLLRHADRAMYVGAKQSGRNRVSIYA